MRILFIAITCILLSGCAITRAVEYQVTCDKCSTSFGSGDKLLIKIKKYILIGKKVNK